MCSRHRWVSCLVLFLTLFGLLFPGGALAGSNSQPAGTLQATLPTPPFNDVVGTDYEGDVGALWKLGVAGGTSPTTFSPWDKVTRAQAAAFIIRALKKSGETAGGNIPFEDVPKTHYALNAISLANQLGIIKGTTQSTFEPDGFVTHAQLTTMLMRALGYESLVTGEWPANYVLKAKDVGLLEGIPFELNKEATRAETARFLLNAIFKVKNPFSNLALSQTVFRLPVKLAIQPDTVYVDSDGVSLSGTGLDWFGNPIEVDRLQWSIVSGSGRLNGSKLTISNGSVTVQGQSGEISATRTFTLATSFQVTPATTVIRPDQTVTLIAALLVDGRDPVPVTANWSVTSGPATVSQSGVVTMTGAGTAIVSGKYGSFTQTATIVAGASLAITPADPVVAVGETVSFTAQTAVAGLVKTVPATWSIVSGDGKITAGGLFTAGRQTTVVQASSPGLTATSTVKVINRLEVTPSTASLNKAETVAFSAKAYTSDNQPVTNVKPTWDLSDKSLGILDTDGVLVATGSGTGNVTARFRGLTASASVNVAGDPVSVLVTTSKTSLPANGSSQATITARVVDRNGISVKGTRIITFSTSSTLGSLSSTAVTTETGEATVTLTTGRSSGNLNVFAATPGVISGQVQVSLVAPSPSKIVLSASPSVLNADAVSSSTITATLVDVSGIPTTNLTGGTIPVYLLQSGSYGTLLSTQLSIPIGHTTATTEFRANATMGTASITGNSSIPVEGVNVRTTLVGPATKLGFRTIAATEANGIAQMVIEVEVQDQNGVIRAMDNNQMVSLSATGPGALTLWPVQVIRGVATFRVMATTAGTYTFTANTGNLTPATATGQFVAGAAAKILLAAEPVSNIAADTVSTTTLVAKVVDARNNPVTTYSPLITFKRGTSGQSIEWDGDKAVPAENGVAQLTIKSTAYPGTETFIASASGLTTSESVAIRTTITGVAAKVRVQTITGTTVGGSTTLKVHVLDSNGNLVTRDSGRQISAIPSTATAVINSPQPTVNGIATFTITDTVAETVTVTASANGLDVDAAGNTVAFAAGDPVRIILVAEPAGMAANTASRSWISAYAVDSMGNKLSRVMNVTLALSSATLGTLSNANIVTGTATPIAFFTPNGTLGQVTVTGTSSLPVSPVTLSTYQPGIPNRVVLEATSTGTVAGNVITVKAKILDNNGNVASWLTSGADLTQVGVTVDGANTQTGTTTTTITSSSYGLLLSKGYSSDGITRGAAGFVNGEATLTFTNTKAQTVTLTPFVWYNNLPLQATPIQITTIPGPATQLVSSPATTLLLNAATSSQYSVVLTMNDRYGNPVSGVTDTITVSASNNNYLSLPGGTTFSLGADGRAVVPVTTLVNGRGGSTQLTFTAAKSGQTVRLTITTDMPPDAPQVSFTTHSVSNSAGSVRIYLDATTVRNAAQRLLVFVNGMQVSVYESPSAGTTDLVSEIAAGAYTAAGYLRLADLGGPGVKNVQAYLVTDLGISPASAVFTLTVTP